MHLLHLQSPSKTVSRILNDQPAMSSDPELRAKRAARKVGDQATEDHLSDSQKWPEVSTYVRYGLWLLLSALWGVFGFLFWLPYLLRSCATFLFSVFSSALTDSSDWEAEEKLRLSAQFYRRGFERIYSLRLSYPESRYRQTATSERPDVSSTLWLFGELAWAVVFWGALATAIFGLPDWALV